MVPGSKSTLACMALIFAVVGRRVLRFRVLRFRVPSFKV